MPVIIMIFCIIISLILWNPRNKGIFEEESRLFMTERKPGQKIVCTILKTWFVYSLRTARNSSPEPVSSGLLVDSLLESLADLESCNRCCCNLDDLAGLRILCCTFVSLL